MYTHETERLMDGRVIRSPRDADRAEPATKVMLGIVLVTAGIALTLLNLGIVESELLLSLWPVVPIAAGLALLACPNAGRGAVRGLIGLCLGTMLLVLVLDMLGLIGHLNLELPGLIPALVIGG